MVTRRTGGALVTVVTSGAMINAASFRPRLFGKCLATVALDPFFSSFFLLPLLLGDEVDFSIGFPIRLAARPTRSSYSVFPHHLLLWVGPGLPSGWLSGYQLADGPTWPSYSVAPVPISWRVYGDRSQPSGKSKVSREDATL